MTLQETTKKMEAQMEKMDMFLSIVKRGDEAITPNAVREFLKTVLEVIKTTKQDFDTLSSEKMDEIKEAFDFITEQQNTIFSKVKKDNEKAKASIEKIVTRATRLLDDIQQERELAMGDLQDLILETKAGFAKDKITMMEELKGLIPSPYQLQPTEVRDALQSLEGDERLDVSAIKGLDEMLKDMKAGGNNGVMYAYGGGSSVKSLTQGAGITITDNGNGNFTIAASGGSGSGDVVGGASSTDNAIARYDGTTGKLIQNSGVIIDDSDNISANGLTLASATASTIAIFNGSKTLISASTGTYPSLAEFAYLKGVTSAVQTQLDARMLLSYLDTDTSLAANSDVKVPSQKAIKAYVDSAVTGLLELKGSTDCSGNPNYPAGSKGDSYYVTVAGKIGGASGKSVDIGDVYVALADNAGGTEASVGTSWFVLEHNLSGVVISGGALGTPSSGTLTNCTGLPIAGLVASTSTAIGVGSIELGHATDTTITRVSAGVIAVEGVNVLLNGGALGTPSSATLTNATGLPISGLVASTSTAIGVGSIELGHASDTTISRISAGVAGVEGVALLTVAGGTLTGNIVLGENTSIQLDPAGSADGKYSGITVTGTGGATIAFGDLVTLDKDDSRWELVDISVAAAATGDARGILGIAVTSSTDGGALTILLQGIVRADTNFPTLTIGAPVYASTTGDVVVTQPTTTDHVIRQIGFGLTADELFFSPTQTWVTHT